MDLTPKLPPGRRSRKALVFAAEIHRLRAAGYSFEAIRLALGEAGVTVSRTTVQREVAKRAAIIAAAREPHAPRAPPPGPLPPSAPAAPAVPQGLPGTSQVASSFAGDSRTGKEIVESFMKGRVTNPLMKG